MLVRIGAAIAAAAFVLACRGPAPALGPPPSPSPSPAPSPPSSPAMAAAAAAFTPAVTAVATTESDPVGPKPRAPLSSRPRRHGKPVVVGQVNLNRATEAELRLLPGIGKLRAKAIVGRRQERPFASLDEVARIRGLKSVVRRLRAHLTLDGSTTLRPAPAGKGG